MTGPPDVSIGIVSWNVAEHLGRCLAAIPAALEGLTADVVVVDNASSDASAEVAEAADVRVIRSSENLGYARGMNLALRSATAPVVIALNPDTVPSPGSLRRLVEVLQGRSDVAVVGPLLRRPDGQVEHSVHRFPSVTLLAVANLVPLRLLPGVVRDRLWLAGAVRPDRTGAVDWVVGAVHVLRRDALPADGPYRERWFMYAEDVDLCWRLRQRGWRTWFVGDAEVVHVGSASARQVADRTGAPPWTAATYDWYRLVFGRRRTRLFATLNLLGELRLLLVRLARAVIDRPRRARAREELRSGLELARRHLAVAAGRRDGGS